MEKVEKSQIVSIFRPNYKLGHTLNFFTNQSLSFHKSFNWILPAILPFRQRIFGHNFFFFFFVLEDQIVLTMLKWYNLNEITSIAQKSQIALPPLLRIALPSSACPCLFICLSSICNCPITHIIKRRRHAESRAIRGRAIWGFGWSGVFGWLELFRLD